MITDTDCTADCDERGRGPAVLLVPGSCSTGAAWRAVQTHLDERFNCVTTSLPGYGGVAERRPEADPSIAHVAEGIETVASAVTGPIHLVGHSFGGLVALAVAVRRKVPLASLTMIEPPAVTILTRDTSDTIHLQAFDRLRNEYAHAFSTGEPEAIGKMVDFYGGHGTFALWPERARQYAVETTEVNLRDWQSAYGFDLTPATLAAMNCSTLVIRGGKSHPAMQRVTMRLAEYIAGARLVTVEAAAHFMITTHAADVATIIARHVDTSQDRLSVCVRATAC